MKESLLRLAILAFAAILPAAQADLSAQQTPQPLPPEEASEAESAAPASSSDATPGLHEEQPPAASQPAATAPPLPGVPTYAPSYGPTDIAPFEPEPMNQWLDEVRAQRRAWEERRRAAKEAIDARRRWIDPWGAAQKEAMEHEVQRRRDAFREKIERDRDAFRSYRPWSAEPAPWQEEPSPQNEMPGVPESGSQLPEAPYPPLPGWDNRWYYRGF